MNRKELNEAIDNMSDIELDNKLAELSNIFKPISSSVTLNLQSKGTLSEYKRSYLKMVWALYLYHESEHDANVANELGLTEIFTDNI